MATRSVSVRYSASVGQLVSELKRAENANTQLANSADKAGQKQDQTANRMAAAGAVIALGLGVAVSKFAEFDAAMSGAAAASGATGGELNNLRDAAIKAGADTQYSATQAANAITELSKAGVSTADILGGGLTGALNLAAAGQLEVADAAEIAATAMNQFKLGGDQVNHVADLLAAGANKAQGSVGDMGMALKQTGQVANQTGLSIEETTAGLTAFASAGLIGSDAGTSFKSMLQRLTPQSKEAAGLMDQLGISAYDTQGNFIGLERFAGVLQSRLKDLTPEQRNSALATIFGSDAVRAASVLYEQGATGIHKWTQEVNQQGYAAKQAATLTDNLKGDIERLGGSFDTALIQAGSGANDSLRTLVQTAESLVNIIGEIPGPVLSAAGAFGALVLLGPKVSGLSKTITGPLTQGMARFRDEMALHRALATQVSGGYQRLGDEALTSSAKVSRSAVAMSAARSTIGGLKGAAGGLIGALGGPWGIALAAAGAGLTMWAQKQADARAAADLLSATIDEQTGKFTKASRESVVSSLMGDISPSDIALLEKMGVDFTTLADAALKGGPAFEQQKQKFSDMANEHRRSGGVFSSEANALEALVGHLNLAGDAAEAAKVKQEILNKAKNDAAVADSNMAGSAAAAERGMADAGNAAGDAAGQIDEAGTASDKTTAFLASMGVKSEDAANSLKTLSTAIDMMAGGQRALRASQRDLADSLDALGKAQEAKADKTHTAAQVERDYRAALDKVGESLGGVLKQQMDNNASAADLTKTYNDQRAAVIDSLKAHGVHKDRLNAEADAIVGTRGQFSTLLAEYKKTPQQVATNVKTPGLPKATGDTREFIGVINGVPTWKTTTFTAYTSQAQAAIAELRGEIAAMPKNATTTLTIRRIQNDIKLTQNGVASAGGNIVKAYAAGGVDAPNGHVAEIATSGVRMWAEPETKGEAYIPFANDWRRPRAKAIAAETVKRLGGEVAWHAAGGLYPGRRSRTIPRFAAGGLATATPAAAVGVDLRALAALIRQGGGDTFNAYGIGDEAIQQAIRQKEFREMSRL